jgi:uncharacterized membrane protein
LKGPHFHSINYKRLLKLMSIYGLLLMLSDFVLIMGGATMCWFSPRLRRNWVLGYGSARSMINDDTWQAANRFAGMSLAAMTLFSMSMQVILWPSIESSDVGQTLLLAITLFIPLLVMVLTEKYLAKRFRN